MRSKYPIIPGCLVLSAENFIRRLEFSKAAGNSIHVDVVDNDFVKGHTLPIEQWPRLDIEYAEAHLMVRYPTKMLPALKKAGVTRAIIHVESIFDLDELAEVAKSHDILLGFAVNPDTDLHTVRPYLAISNYVQVMGVTPGKTGQRQVTQTNTAVSYFKSLPSRLTITVDGGVNATNIANLKSSGADYFIASSALYDRGEWLDNYHDLLEKITQ